MQQEIKKQGRKQLIQILQYYSRTEIIPMMN